MNRSIILVVVFVALGMAGVSTGAGVPDSKTDVTKVVEINLTGQEIQDKILVTPNNYKQVLLQNNGTKAYCYYCSSPCPNTICCNDSHPQCCLYQNLCGCCRF